MVSLILPSFQLKYFGRWICDCFSCDGLYRRTAGDALDPDVTSRNKTIVTHLKILYKWDDRETHYKGCHFKVLAVHIRKILDVLLLFLLLFCDCLLIPEGGMWPSGWQMSLRFVKQLTLLLPCSLFLVRGFVSVENISNIFEGILVSGAAVNLCPVHTGSLSILLILWRVGGGTAANPSWEWVRRGVHPGQAVSISHRRIQDKQPFKLTWIHEFNHKADDNFKSKSHIF